MRTGIRVHPDRCRLALGPGCNVVEVVPAYVVVYGPRRGSHEAGLTVSQEYYLLRALGERNAYLVYPCCHVERPRGVTAYQVDLCGFLQDHRPV